MITARPRAKLNLTLEVGERGEDGLHSLRSIFLRIGLADRLTVRPSTADRDSLRVEGFTAGPAADNTVLRALAVLREATGQRLPPLEVELDKRIPVGAGLAGGSSDGAAALELAAACWGVGLAPEQRLRLAAALGSDVPFFAAHVPAALVEGRGELVTPLPPVAGRPGVLLLTPPVQVSTARAFAYFDDHAPYASRDAGDGPTDELAAALRASLDAVALADLAPRLQSANDLWPAAAALAPILPGLRDGLQEATGRPWLLTGSGSSLYTFYPSPEEAAAAGAELIDRQGLDLDGAFFCAADFDGPDPAWRQP
jgi:4-diphosphocytidyl-2-C-methyl-D-erythritol kinase